MLLRAKSRVLSCSRKLELPPALPSQTRCSTSTASQVYNENVFSDTQMLNRMGEKDYKNFKETIRYKRPVSPDQAEQFAKALKTWAHSKGVTHYAHSFYPLSGALAGKQNTFLEPVHGSQDILEHFTGTDLSISETDGSSFPNGGSRLTHEARAYCVWDPTTPPYIMDAHRTRVLYVPCVFFGWNGALLDKRIPMLRSEEYLVKTVKRLFAALGLDATQDVRSDVGVEQEFFLIDREMYLQRLDMRMTGRTLFGRPSAKHQQLDDHYFADLGARSEALDEMAQELWRLGIPLKQRHKEVAPSQYEMAPVFESGLLATNHNLMTMRVMRDVARKHNLECVFHEKPFAGINGTARHNNWSVGTTDYPTIFWPTRCPDDVFLAAVAAQVRAVAQNGDLLRFSASSAGNDHRLGGHEAPPAIMSVYLGESVTQICEDVMAGREPDFSAENRVCSCRSGKDKDKGKKIDIDMGISLLPEIHVANHDRNRTSPVAFTSNKFEFRSCGGAQSAADHTYMLNTIFAESLDRIAEEIEKRGVDKTREVLAEFLKENFHAVFNGDGYSDEWPIEAARRGLPNLKTTPDVLETFNSDKNKEVFKRTGVLSEQDMGIVEQVNYETYNTQLQVEATCSLNLLNRKVIPAGFDYVRTVSEAVKNEGKDESPNKTHLELVQNTLSRVTGATATLRERMQRLGEINDVHKQAEFHRDTIIPTMSAAREAADELEGLVPEHLWPLPSYTQILWSEDVM